MGGIFHAHVLELYVYQYATGISGANALAAGVLAGADGAVERYLEFPTPAVRSTRSMRCNGLASTRPSRWTRLRRAGRLRNLAGRTAAVKNRPQMD